MRSLTLALTSHARPCDGLLVECTTLGRRDMSDTHVYFSRGGVMKYLLSAGIVTLCAVAAPAAHHSFGA